MEYLFSPGQYVSILEKVGTVYNTTQAMWKLNAAVTQRSTTGEIVNTPSFSSLYRWPSTVMSDVQPTWYAGDGTEFHPAVSEEATYYPENNDIATWAIRLTPLGKLKDYWANIILPNWRSALSVLESQSSITWGRTNLAFIANMIARPS